MSLLPSFPLEKLRRSWAISWWVSSPEELLESIYDILRSEVDTGSSRVYETSDPS